MYCIQRPVRVCVMVVSYHRHVLILVIINRQHFSIVVGHLIGPVLCHAFCNHMGFPDVNEVLNEDDFDRKAKAICFYLLGPVVFFMLLNVLTAPMLFSNSVYHKFLL